MAPHCSTDFVSIQKHVHCILPPTKKLKVSPFDWFQHAPDDSVVPSASNTPACTEPLSERVGLLNEIRKYETEFLPSHSVNDVFDPLHWWGQLKQQYPLLSDWKKHCWLFPLLRQNVNDF